MGKDEAPEWRRMKAQVEKDERPEAETLLRLLIVAKGLTGKGRRPKWRRIKPPSGEG